MKPVYITTERQKLPELSVTDGNGSDSLEKSDGQLVGQLSVNPQSRSKRKSLGMRKRFRILRKCRFRCYYCGTPAQRVELEIDHVVPIARGGTDDEKNLVAACIKCNRGKGDGPSLEALAPDRCDVTIFVEECLVRGRSPSSALYACLQTWLANSRRAPMSQTAFGRRLTELGYRELRSNGTRLRPLAIKPPEVLRDHPLADRVYPKCARCGHASNQHNCFSGETQRWTRCAGNPSQHCQEFVPPEETNK